MPKDQTQTRRSELLMPAGSLERLKVAVLYGADAVYLGTPDMSLRTKSKFSLEDVKEGVAFAHAHGVRVYLTLNLFTHNKDVEKLESFIETLKDIRPDGVIIADPGVFNYVRKHAPELNLHHKKVITRENSMNKVIVGAFGLCASLVCSTSFAMSKAPEQTPQPQACPTASS